MLLPPKNEIVGLILRLNDYDLSGCSPHVLPVLPWVLLVRIKKVVTVSRTV